MEKLVELEVGVGVCFGSSPAHMATHSLALSRRFILAFLQHLVWSRVAWGGLWLFRRSRSPWSFGNSSRCCPTRPCKVLGFVQAQGNPSLLVPLLVPNLYVLVPPDHQPAGMPAPTGSL